MKTKLSNVDRLVSVKLTQSPTFNDCSPNWTAELHLKDFDLWHVYGGQGIISVNGQSHIAGPGFTYLYVPGDHVVASHDPDNTLQVFACHFSTGLSTNVDYETFFSHCRPLQLRDNAQFIEWARQCTASYHLHNRYATKQAELLLRLLLFQLWKESDQPTVAPRDIAIQDLLSKIRLNPEKTWTLEDMGHACSLSSTYLNSRVRTLTRMSPKQYVIHTRVERAKVLLLESRMNLEQIADALGYTDVYFFSRQFRKVAKMSPGHYRQKRKHTR